MVQPRYNGAMLPLGGIEVGHKGYALGLLGEALTGGLAGHGRADPVEGWAANVLVQILDPACFGGEEDFRRQMHWLAEACRAAPPRPGFDHVRLPGEEALARRAVQLARHRPASFRRRRPASLEREAARSLSSAAAMRLSQHGKGVLLMIGATLCWASAGMLVRNMHLARGWEITFWRSLFMTLFVLAVLVAQYRGATLDRIRAVGKPGVIVSLLWALMYVCFILALGRTTVANVLVLTTISPFAAALLSWLFLRERIPTRTWVAMIVTCAGIALMFAESIDGGGLEGNLIALAIPVAFACNVVILRSMHASVDMIPTLVLSGLFSMLLTVPLAVPFEATAWDFALLAIMGVVQLGIGCLLMLAAAPRLKAAEIGLLAVLEIVFGTLSTWWLVGERPGRVALIGGLVVIGALIVNELIGLRGKPASPSEETAAATQAGH